MTIISVEQASNSLIDLIKKVNDGEEVIITDGEEPVAKIIATSKKYLRDKKKIKSVRTQIQNRLPLFNSIFS